MDAAFKYQQDTLQLKTLLQQSSGNMGKRVVQTGADSLASNQVKKSEASRVQTGTKNLKQNTVPESRNKLWKSEQKMLIGDSRYIQPKNEVRLTTTTKTADVGLTLPNRALRAENTDWLTILLILILVLFATVRNSYAKYLDNLFQSLVNYSTSFRMFEERNYSFLSGAFRLEVYFYLTFSIFLFQIIKYFNVGLPYKNFGLYLFCLGLVLLYFILKKLAYKMVGFITEGIGETSEYLFNMDNVNRITGMALFPFVLLIAFFPFSNIFVPVFLGIISVAAMYFLLLQRGFIILLKKQFSIFYLFLYFCTLEFLPLVLLYKIVV